MVGATRACDLTMSILNATVGSPGGRALEGSRDGLRQAGPPSAATVRRERLVRRLRAAGSARVVLITAPAGYGKSTLLASWERADPRPFGWLGADEVAAMAAERRMPQQPTVLVVDGHAAGAAGLRRLIAALPAGSLLVLASRYAARVPVSRLRAELGILELGPRDLAMTSREDAAVLRGAGVALSDTAERTLLDRVDGWPAAVRLAALALSAADDPEAAALAFGGDDPYIADYVRDEVLADLPPNL